MIQANRQDAARGVSEGGGFLLWSDVPSRSGYGRLWVYGLVDPRDMTLRYVGVTRKLRPRLERHLAEPTNSQCRAWFAELHAIGRKPLIRPIYPVVNGAWQQAEMYWIAWCRARGQLYNVDPGGKYRDDQGAPIPRMERTAERMAASVARGATKPPRPPRTMLPKPGKPKWARKRHGLGQKAISKALGRGLRG